MSDEVSEQLETYGLDNRATAASNSDITSCLHEVGGADSLVLVRIVPGQQEVAVAL
jgi:hypothetical protein